MHNRPHLTRLGDSMALALQRARRRDKWATPPGRPLPHDPCRLRPRASRAAACLRLAFWAVLVVTVSVAYAQAAAPADVHSPPSAPPAIMDPAVAAVRAQLPEVVARVGAWTVTRDRIWPRIRSRVELALAAEGTLPESLLRFITRPVLNAIIDEFLLGPKARDAGFLPDVARAQAHLEAMVRDPSAAAAFAGRLRHEGLSREEYVQEVAARTAIMDWVRQTFVAGQEATAEEVQALYDTRRADLFMAETVCLERVLVPVAGDVTEARQQARECARRLRALVAGTGVPLAEAPAALDAAEPGATGSARWESRRVPVGELPEEVRDAIARLEAGEISPVIDLPEAAAVVRWSDRVPRRLLALAEVEESLRENVREGKGRALFRTYLDDLRRSAPVVIYPPLEDRPLALPGMPVAPDALRP